MQRIIEFKIPENPINLFPQINWKDYAQEIICQFNPDSCNCQRCNKSIWAEKVVASYARKFVYPYNGERQEGTLYIRVILCKECGKSEDGTGTENGDYNHAILGGLVIPFTKYSLPFILTVLDCYVKRTVTVERICEQWGICRNTLYKWRKRFMDQYNLWTDSLHTTEALMQEIKRDEPNARNLGRRALVTAISLTSHMIEAVVCRFFLRFTYSFMQPSKKTHLRELPKGRRPRFL